MLVFRGFFSLSYNPVLQGSEGVYLREMSGICRHSGPSRLFPCSHTSPSFLHLEELVSNSSELMGEHRGAPSTDWDGERNGYEAKQETRRRKSRSRVNLLGTWQYLGFLFVLRVPSLDLPCGRRWGCERGESCQRCGGLG